MTPPDAGSFPLSGVAALPNVQVAFPGEHWSDRKASASSAGIVPGEAVVPINSGGKLYMRRAGAGDAPSSRQLAIALRTVDHPDVNSGPTALGPNEIRNQKIANGEYVHAYYSGAFHLTLIKPDAYAPGDLIAWDHTAARPTGKGGFGAWAKTAVAADAFFEVQEWRPYGDVANEGVLTVRSLRGQF